MKEERQKIEHPSYGMISAHRSNCNPAKIFYGAETRHNNFIVLEISTSNVTRGLKQDWYYSDKKLISVALTPLQWAELLTTMNTSGVPCTIEWIKDKGRIENPPELNNKIDLHKLEFEEYTNGVLQSIKNSLNELENCIDANKGKKALLEQLENLKTTTRNLKPNMDFAISQFDNHIDKVVTESKQKIESIIEHKIISLGKDALNALNSNSYYNEIVDKNA